MGNCIRTILNKLRRRHIIKKNIVLLMVGLDDAGKTVVLNHISNDPDRHVMSTMGFRLVSLNHKLYSIKVYDVGGAPQIRSIWKKYYCDIHGLIYVVDASNISRLTENKIVFGELISHENIAGKPILLLANKQDIRGAIDELDLVENLDVERAANAMRCPTRVETCSCVYEAKNSKHNTMGINNGFKWLIETISKNYSSLDHRIKASQTLSSSVNNNIRRKLSITSLTPSRASIHSNPFKPIREFIKNSEQNGSDHINHVDKKKTSSIKKILVKNKTGPMPLDQQINQDIKTLSNKSVIEIEPFHEDASNDQVSLVTLDPLNFYSEHRTDHLKKQSRPFTAPALFNNRVEISTMINIPGQVLH
ncbi:hypothetical protein PV326_003958 [Microctonus aethiopoides]|nr:hypothetical protein PV326_003958 [Microctonus aethiopoides]